MPRRLLRTVCATLVATFAILASAAALCLLPCELTPAVRAGADGPSTGHCADAAPARSEGPAVNGIDDSCGVQHAWAAPAADRLTSRASVVATAALDPAEIALRLSAGIQSPGGPAATAAASPPTRSGPLRI